MTRDEACALLGLDPGAAVPAGELKRAYLRAVKRHKPEVDPQGFQRVRAAFELLEATPAGSPALAHALAAPVAQAAPAHALAAPVGFLTPEALAALLETPAPTTTEPHDDDPPVNADPRVDPLAEVRAQIDGLWGAPWPLRADVARAALAERPDDADARQLLLEQIPNEARGERIAALLAGIEHGDRACFGELLFVAPEAIPADARDRILREGTADERLLIARGLLAEGRPGDAVALYELALAGEELPNPFIATLALRFILTLHQGGHADRATGALGRLRRYLGPAGLPAGGPELGTRLSVVSELEMCPQLPPELRREIARGALEEDFSGVPGALIVAERRHGRRALARWAAHAKKHAPTIAALIHVPGRSRETWYSRGWVNTWVLSVVVMAVVRLVYTGFSSTPSKPTPLQLTGNIADWLELDRGRLELCADGRNQELCTRLDPVFARGFAPGDCPSVRAGLFSSLTLGAVASPEARSYLRAFDAFLTPYCPRTP